MNPLIEIIGWLGAVLVLLAYGLLSAHRLSSRSVAYQVLNIAGSIGLVINSGWNGAIPSAVVNVIWLGIGAHAVWRMRAQPKRRNGRRTRHVSAPASLRIPSRMSAGIRGANPSRMPIRLGGVA